LAADTVSVAVDDSIVGAADRVGIARTANGIFIAGEDNVVIFCIDGIAVSTDDGVVGTGQNLIVGTAKNDIALTVLVAASRQAIADGNIAIPTNFIVAPDGDIVVAIRPVIVADDGISFTVQGQGVFPQVAVADDIAVGCIIQGIVCTNDCVGFRSIDQGIAITCHLIAAGSGVQRVAVAADQVVIALHRVAIAEDIIGITTNSVFIAHQQIFTGAVQSIGCTHYGVVFRTVHQGVAIANHLIGAGGGVQGIVIAIDTVVIAINGVVITEDTIIAACD